MIVFHARQIRCKLDLGNRVLYRDDRKQFAHVGVAGSNPFAIVPSQTVHDQFAE